MNCREIRDMILTDYLDGEQWEERSIEVEKHLTACSACRDFATQVKEKTVLPLQQSKPIQVDEEVIWQNIKAEIETEDRPLEGYRPSFFASWAEHLRAFWGRPKVVWSFARVALLLAIMVLQFKVVYDGRMAKQKAAQEEVQYLAYVVEEFMFEESNGDETNGAGFGTAIEEYFL